MSRLEIVVLQRGWVVCGRPHPDNGAVMMPSGFIVRRWGTSNGLGQLAADGPQARTVLDPFSHPLRWHPIAEVCRFECSEEKWTGV